MENYEELYQELLYAVVRVHPGQTRHQTALMYITSAENQDNPPEAGDSQCD